MARAHQHPALARDQRKDVAGGDDVVARLGRIDRDRNRPRAVGRADPGGHALARLDRNGEGGFVAGAVAVLGAWPGMIDHLARIAGISYPPALLLLLASALLLVKALHSDMVNTRIERDVRRLNQRLALLEADLALAGHTLPPGTEASAPASAGTTATAHPADNA